MSTHKIMVAGFGGQGVILIGQMIAYAAMYDGKEVTWMPSYGPEMRGGTANCSVIVSDKKISAPVIAEGGATAVVAMNQPSLLKFESLLAPGGKLFVNTSLIEAKPVRTDIQVVNVDANELAVGLANLKVANMVMLGAIVRETGVVSIQAIEKVMDKQFTGSKAKLLPLNKQALTAWQAE